MFAKFFVVSLASILVAHVSGKPGFVSLIPNGMQVPNPCSPTQTWLGVGHQNPSGGGALNSFGADFHSAGMVWSTAICQRDSDGDGMTNGQELGDPNCQWRQGQANPTGQISHPGVCEPTTAPQCQSKNTFLSASCSGSSSAAVVASSAWTGNTYVAYSAGQQQNTGYSNTGYNTGNNYGAYYYPNSGYNYNGYNTGYYGNGYPNGYYRGGNSAGDMRAKAVCAVLPAAAFAVLRQLA